MHDINMVLTEEDEDVVFEGTALYEHLVQNGFESEMEMVNKSQGFDSANDLINHTNDGETKRELEEPSREVDLSDYKHFQKRLTLQILRTELLVLEDEEFMRNFTEFEDRGNQKCYGLSSLLKLLASR